MVKIKTLCGLALLILVLSGCFLPDNQRSENRIAYPDQLQSVQLAVNQFQDDTGVLPIRTFDENTPKYNRYVIDFNQLMPRYIQQPPGTAFENGGVFRYVLVNVEEEPEVKVSDMSSQRTIAQYQQRVNDYIRQNTYIPVQEVLDPGLFQLDYEELGYKEAPFITSPYTQNPLPLLFTHDREVIIDYRVDINMLLMEHGHSFESGEDIRSILYEHSPFIPARSVPYVLNDENEPIYAMHLRDEKIQ